MEGNSGNSKMASSTAEWLILGGYGLGIASCTIYIMFDKGVLP